MKRTERLAYGITLYRDEDGEASVDTRFVGTEDTAKAAIAEAQKAGPATGWPLWSATVDLMTVVTERVPPGIDLVTYEDGPYWERWYIGPDWMDGPETYEVRLGKLE